MHMLVSLRIAESTFSFLYFSPVGHNKPFLFLGTSDRVLTLQSIFPSGALRKLDTVSNVSVCCGYNRFVYKDVGHGGCRRHTHHWDKPHRRGGASKPELRVATKKKKQFRNPFFDRNSSRTDQAITGTFWSGGLFPAVLCVWKSEHVRKSNFTRLTVHWAMAMPRRRDDVRFETAVLSGWSYEFYR